MPKCPWDLSLDVSIVGDGLYLNGARIPVANASEFLTWLSEVVSKEVV